MRTTQKPTAAIPDHLSALLHAATDLMWVAEHTGDLADLPTATRLRLAMLPKDDVQQWSCHLDSVVHDARRSLNLLCQGCGEVLADPGDYCSRSCYLRNEDME